MPTKICLMYYRLQSTRSETEAFDGKGFKLIGISDPIDNEALGIRFVIELVDRAQLIVLPEEIFGGYFSPVLDDASIEHDIKLFYGDGITGRTYCIRIDDQFEELLGPCDGGNAEMDEARETACRRHPNLRKQISETHFKWDGSM